jgi:glucose-1-phosphate cytidylyltransferase
MKVVILAGGYGTRISEESYLKPKPMIEINGKPILWHIMKYYSTFGYNEFIICCGYKGYVIKEYFANYFMHRSDITFDFSHGKNEMTIHNNISEPWKVTLIDTGIDTMTGGRIKRIQDYIKDEDFLLTYGDGLSDIDIAEVVKGHKERGKIATICAIQPGGRWGVLKIEKDDAITEFIEKRKEDGGWINGGFMVLNKKIFDYIDGDKTVFEKEPLEKLTKQNQLYAYKHKGFWQCMDTLRDKTYLEELLTNGEAPWVKW